MVNHWYNIKNNIKSKKYSLRCIGAGIILFMVLYVLTKVYKCSLCPVKYLFGISCFGCGLTRSFISVLHLDFISATKYNVMSVPLFFSIAIYLSIYFLDVILNKNYIKVIDKILSHKYMYIVYIVFLILNIYLNDIIVACNF